jgi:hypothetical protein
MRLELDEAIRIGSLLVQEPKVGDINACVLGMAAKAVGCKETRVLPITAFIKREWPWLGTRNVASCPQCGLGLMGSERVWHLFDRHIMEDRTMTIDQLADYVATIEPKEEIKEQITTTVTEEVLL